MYHANLATTTQHDDSFLRKGTSRYISHSTVGRFVVANGLLPRRKTTGSTKSQQQKHCLTRNFQLSTKFFKAKVRCMFTKWLLTLVTLLVCFVYLLLISYTLILSLFKKATWRLSVGSFWNVRRDHGRFSSSEAEKLSSLYQQHKVTLAARQQTTVLD